MRSIGSYLSRIARFQTSYFAHLFKAYRLGSGEHRIISLLGEHPPGLKQEQIAGRLFTPITVKKGVFPIKEETLRAKKEKLWTLPYLCIIFMSTFQACQMQMVNPLMSKYTSEIGVSLHIVGMIVGIFSIAALIIRPISGPIADRFNNRVVASAGALTMGVATIGYIIAGTSVPLIFFFRFLHGVSFGVCGTTLMRMASYFIPASRMGEGMGYFGLGQVLATAIAPSIGIALAASYGYLVTFVVSAIVVVGVGVLALFLNMPEAAVRPLTARPPLTAPPAGETSAGASVRVKKRFSLSLVVAREAVFLALIAGCISFVNSLETGFMVLYGENLGIGNIGIYFTVSAASMFLIRLITGKLFDRKGMSYVLYPALCLITLAMLLCGGVGLFGRGAGPALLLVLLLVCSTLKGVGQGSAQPALQTACLQSVAPARRGVASSTYYMGCDIGQGIGPMIGGVVAGQFGYAAIYFTAAAVMLGGIGFYTLYSRRQKKADTLSGGVCPAVASADSADNIPSPAGKTADPAANAVSPLSANTATDKR